MDIKIWIGCICFTPHAWDIHSAYIRNRYGGATSLDKLILALADCY